LSRDDWWAEFRHDKNLSKPRPHLSNAQLPGKSRNSFSIMSDTE